MRGIVAETRELIKKAWFSLPLLACWLISFTYSVLHPAAGLDDLNRSRYVAGGLYLLYQRFGGYTVMWLLEQFKCGEHFQAFLIAAFMLLAALLFCILFRRTSKDRLPLICYTVFACLFVSYPITVEIFIFADTGLFVAIGYALIAVILLFCESQNGWKRWTVLLLAAFLLAFTVSSFQALAPVYVCLVGALITVKALYGDQRRFKDTFLDGLRYAGLLIAGLLMMLGVNKLILFLMQAEPLALGTQIIAWRMEMSSIVRRFGSLWRYFLRYIVAPIPFYWPLTLLGASVLLSAVLSCIALKQRCARALLPIGVMTLSLMLMPLVQGFFFGYRVFLSFAPYVGTIFMLFTAWAFQAGRRQALSRAVAGLSLGVALVCALCTDGLFRLDDLRYQEDKQAALAIYSDLEAGSDLRKPTVFVGSIALSDDIYSACRVDTGNRLYNRMYGRINALEDSIQFIDFATDSLLSWGVDAFYEPNTELIRLYRYLGCDKLIQASVEQYKEALKIAQDMPGYPDAGYIRDAGDFTVVRMGVLPDG